jgi:hypothetical protein
VCHVGQVIGQVRAAAKRMQCASGLREWSGALRWQAQLGQQQHPDLQCLWPRTCGQLHHAVSKHWVSHVWLCTCQHNSLAACRFRVHCCVVWLSQAYILFRAELAAPYSFSAGAESLEVALFEPDSIPFDEVRVQHTQGHDRCWVQTSSVASTLCQLAKVVGPCH